MSLEDVKNELYRKGSNIERRKHAGSQFDPMIAQRDSAQAFQAREKWNKSEEKLEPYQKKAIKIAAAISGILVILAGVYWLVITRARSAFSEERVTVEILGPARVDSNQLVEYAIRYKNENRVSLKNIEISLNYTENFQPEENAEMIRLNANNSKIQIKEIAPRSGGSIKVQGKFFAPENYTIALKSTVRYVPSNFNSTFEKKNNVNVEIKSSPITIDIDAPLEASDGNKIEYVVDYKNISARDFGNMRMEAEYPGGFTFISAEPRPSEGNNFWYLGNLGENENGQIRIQGELYGTKNEAKNIKLFLRSVEESGNQVSYGEREKLTRIVTSPLTIRQIVNGSEAVNVNAGDRLQYALSFRNDGQIGLRNVIVTCEIKGTVLDFAGLRVGNTSYESQNGIITWKAVDFPQLNNLQPGKEGVVEFSIPIKSDIPLASQRDKNFEIISIARIDSPDIPTPVGSNKIISSSKVTLKVNSDVVLETKGYYDDWRIKNFGAVPPRIGQETSYALHWLITNKFNDISGVELESSLPTGVKWTGEVYPENEKISFNERTNMIKWEVGEVASGTGVLSPKREVSFQVSIAPEINSLGQIVTLLNPAKLIAEDDFTGNKIRLESEGKNTKLKEDSSLTLKDYVVAGAIVE